MDHSRAPLLEALAEYHRLDRYGFTPPGHRQGRGAGPRTVEVLGADTFATDMLAGGGLDARSSSGGYLKQAEELMADAVGAEHAFFSTCGSSLSVKAAMLAMAGDQGDLLVCRDGDSRFGRSHSGNYPSSWVKTSRTPGMGGRSWRPFVFPIGRGQL